MEPRNVHGKGSQLQVENSRGKMSSVDNECPGSLKEAFQATAILAGLMEQAAFKVNFWIEIKEKMRENL